MVYFELRPRTKFSTAEVAELADALASGASSRKGVKVRVLSSAPNPSLRSVFGAAESLAHAAYASGMRHGFESFVGERSHFPQRDSHENSDPLFCSRDCSHGPRVLACTGPRGRAEDLDGAGKRRTGA